MKQMAVMLERPPHRKESIYRAYALQNCSHVQDGRCSAILSKFHSQGNILLFHLSLLFVM
eukprot:UN12108